VDLEESRACDGVRVPSAAHAGRRAASGHPLASSGGHGLGACLRRIGASGFVGMDFGFLLVLYFSFLLIVVVVRGGGGGSSRPGRFCCL